jgi:hypothetical protein
MMPPTITLKITDNADRPLASMEVPVPLSGEPGECAMFDAERFERLLDRAAIAFRRVFDEEVMP